jgi:hypothetical protein
MNPHRSPGYAGMVAVAVSLAACAAFPPPTEQLAAARAAIQSNEMEGAGRSAPVELTQAREKLTAAETAVRESDPERARRLADEALVDAQFAQAKASTARSQEGVAQAEAALRALREEANRPTTSPATNPGAPATVAPTR